MQPTARPWLSGKRQIYSSWNQSTPSFQVPSLTRTRTLATLLGVRWEGFLRSPVHIKHPAKQNSKKPERSSYGKTPLLIFLDLCHQNETAYIWLSN